MECRSEPTIQLVTDHDLLAEAFHWSSDAPRWFRESEEHETLEEFLANADRCLFYGIFDGEMKALLRLTPFAQGVFAVDLFARRSTDRELLTQAALSIQTYLYDREIANGFFGWIPTFNRSVRAIYARLGFQDSGVSCYRGKTHNRPVKWLLMVNSRNEENGQKENNAD